MDDVYSGIVHDDHNAKLHDDGSRSYSQHLWYTCLFDDWK